MKQGNGVRIMITLGLGGLALLVSACAPALTAAPDSSPIGYEVIAQEAELGDFSEEGFALALRGKPQTGQLPTNLPPGALQALDASSDTLTLLIYAGSQPSGGFQVQIDDITEQTIEGRQALVVRYHVQPPDPETGAITAITFPYLVVRVESKLDASQVVFEQTQ